MRNRVKPTPIATSRSTKNFSRRTWEEDQKLVKVSQDFCEVMIARYDEWRNKPTTLKIC